MHLLVGSLAGDEEVAGKISSSRGDLMAIEDSVDEGGGGRSAIRPLDGLSELEP